MTDAAGAAATGASTEAATTTTTATPADAAAAAAASTAATTTTTPAAQAPAAQGPSLDMTGWPQAAIDAYTKRDGEAQRYQREAGDERINSKKNAAAEARAELLAEFNKVINPDAATDAPPTVEALTAQLGDSQGKLDASDRSQAALMEAWQQGVDPTKLDYLKFKLSTDQAFTSLDPKAADFAAKVKASIAAQVAADPSLKLAGSAAASGVEQLGGAGGASTITPEAFNGMNMLERSELYRSDRATYDKLVSAQ